jgi:hypothetical protein
METKALLLGCKCDHSGELFHTTYKKIQGQGVTLPNSTLTRKKPMDVTIDCYRVRGRGNTLHNEQNNFGRETKLAEKAS